MAGIPLDLEENIYSSGPPNPWTVIVGYEAGFGIVVSSGNKDSDWNVIVADSALASLKTALEKVGAESQNSGSDEQHVIALLKSAFGGREKNPFEEITEFLRTNSIPFKEQSWIGD